MACRLDAHEPPVHEYYTLTTTIHSLRWLRARLCPCSITGTTGSISGEAHILRSTMRALDEINRDLDVDIASFILRLGFLSSVEYILEIAKDILERSKVLKTTSSTTLGEGVEPAKPLSGHSFLRLRVLVARHTHGVIGISFLGVR
jgi:hypothetical protein